MEAQFSMKRFLLERQVLFNELQIVIFNRFAIEGLSSE